MSSTSYQGCIGLAGVDPLGVPVVAPLVRATTGDAVIRFDPRTYRYTSRRPGQAALEQRIRETCQTRVRFGYRRVHVLLRREGWQINAKKTYRIYKGLGVQLRNKTPKRRVKSKLRDDRKEAVGLNDVWAMDFVHDQLATGRKIRVVTVVDTFSRFVQVLDARLT